MYLRETSLFMAATLATFTISATPSHASDDQPTARVSYGDLNLGSKAGARTFGFRLHAQSWCSWPSWCASACASAATYRSSVGARASST